MAKKLTVVERFMSKVQQTDGCWTWTGGTFDNGYGVFSWGGKTMKAHRVAWVLANGDIPDGMLVCHRCDNRLCVNPDHMFLGTNQDNATDRHEKGRDAAGDQHGQSGTKNWKNKLTEQDVVSIRQLYGTGGYQQKQLAEMFGVDRRTIGAIVNKVNWGWING